MITVWCTNMPGLVDEAFTLFFLALTSRNETRTSNRILRFIDEDTPNIIRYRIVDHDIMDNLDSIRQWFTTTYYAKYIYDVEVSYGKWELSA